MTKDAEKKGRPTAGTARSPRGGAKPNTADLSMVNRDGKKTRSQPKGWGIAKVIDIFTGKPKG